MENTIEVTGCVDCPMYYSKHPVNSFLEIVGEEWNYCNHPDKTKGRSGTKYELNKQCPLKNSPVTIKLKDNDRTES